MKESAEWGEEEEGGDEGWVMKKTGDGEGRVMKKPGDEDVGDFRGVRPGLGD